MHDRRQSASMMKEIRWRWRCSVYDSLYERMLSPPPPSSSCYIIHYTPLSSSLQVADRPSKNTVSVGGAVLVVSSELEESQRLRGTTMQLSPTPPLTPTSCYC